MERIPGEEEGPHASQLLLLKGISGAFRPGVLTALMGASGAGKVRRLMGSLVQSCSPANHLNDSGPAGRPCASKLVVRAPPDPLQTTRPHVCRPP